MKYITLIIGLLVVGCGKQEQTDANESTPTTTEKPVKELTAEEKVVGTYEAKIGEDTLRVAFLENGIFEKCTDGEKDVGREGGQEVGREYKWKVVNGEIHIEDEDGDIGVDVARINKDGTITGIAEIRNGKREDFPKGDQVTFRKIKSKPVANNNATKLVADNNATKPVKELTAEEKKVVGTYEMNEADGTTEKPVKEPTKEDVVGSYEARGGGDTYKQVFLDNGVYEWRVIGKKEWGAKWKIVNRELHIDIGDGYISVWKINEDNSITKIAYIEDGKRTGLPKEPPLTYIKIK